MNFRLFATIFTLIIGLQSFGQTGTIKGQVKDGSSGELIYGAKVVIAGTTKGAMTDTLGLYSLTVAPGTYKIVVSTFGYTNDTISGVVVKAKGITPLNIDLASADKILQDVEVIIKRSTNTESSLLEMKKNNAAAVDGISAQSISKTVDNRASDVMKRVSGASVQDNKFIVIRGLGDRYNFGMINGAPLPSSESDRKAFAFDIFPAIMLDNLTITKTATPDMPGEFAGGVINVSTVEPRKQDFHSIQIGTNINTITTFRDYATYKGGSWDFLGLGANAANRALPDGLPSTVDFTTLTKAQRADYAKLMNYTWDTHMKKALPGLNIQYVLGKSYYFKNKPQRSFGFAVAYNYRNEFNYNQVSRNDFEEQSTGVVQTMALHDSVFTQRIINSGMANLSFNLNNKNRFMLKTMLSDNSDDKTSIRNGVREMNNDPHQYEKSTNFSYTENKMLTSQLIGEHDLKKGKLTWNIATSQLQRNVAQRRIVYRKYANTEDDTTTSYAAVIQSTGTIPTAAGNMFWSTTTEKIYSARYDYTLPFQIDSIKTDFKIGGFHQYRHRDFTSRNLGFSQYKPTGSSFDYSLLSLPANEIFSVDNLGLLENGLGGFKLEEATKVDDSYRASSMLNAGYAMIDSKLTKKWRVVGGARLEAYEQVFEYTEFGSNENKRIDTTVIDILPSVNVIYSMNKKLNLRAAYYKTVSRPEFRELAPFAFYNFAQDNILSGNPELKRALINNYDIRAEYFPSSGQVVSLSGFYKQFKDPIELINRTGTSGAAELYYTNVAGAYNYGAELEYRVELGFLSKKEDHRFFDYTTLFTNASLIRSKVDLSGFNGTGGDRPLQGQSPYILNAGLNYSSKENNWSVNLTYNVVGQRIYIVGNEQEPSVWENRRNVVDFQVSKLFFKERFEVKINVRDLLAQKQVYFQDLNNNQRYDAGVDNEWQSISYGRNISLNLKYIFK